MAVSTPSNGCSGEIPTPQERVQLEEFAAAVRASPHNLMSQHALERLWERHIPECVALARQLPLEATVLDVGTGGGFPGVVLAICRPDLRIEMAEATQKKAAFLREVLESLELDAMVHAERGEDLTSNNGTPRVFDVVTARAVAPLSELVELVAHLIAEGGELWAIKGRRWPDELEAAEHAINAHGLTVRALPARHVDSDATPAPRVVIIGRPAMLSNAAGET